MDINLERDGGVIGTLFQQIINDMKVSTNRFNYSAFISCYVFFFLSVVFQFLLWLWDRINQIGCVNTE